MTDNLRAYDAYIEEHFDAFVDELRAFCAQPALAGPAHRPGRERGLVREKLEALGGQVTVVPVDDGAPVILGELGAGPRTLLLYNHYDVQPPEPLELWDSPPYAGAIRDGKFYARGVADDRGDLLGRIQAIRAYQATVRAAAAAPALADRGRGRDRQPAPGAGRPRACRLAARRLVRLGERQPRRGRTSPPSSAA